MKSSLLLLLLLMGTLIAPLNSTRYHGKASICKLTDTYSNKPHMDEQTIPILNITLTNDTTLEFNSIDEATKFLYNSLVTGSLSEEEIKNITLVYFYKYIEAVKGRRNLTSTDIVPAYKAFFIKKSSVENYTGTYVPMDEKEAFINKVSMLSRSLLYGRIGDIIFADIYNDTYSIDSADFSIVVFLNTSEQETFQAQINELREKSDIIANMTTNFYLIDVSNNKSALLEASQTINNTNVIFVLDSNITINDNKIESFYNTLGFERVVPSSAIISSKGFLLRKSFGSVNVSEIESIIQILKKGYIGLIKYMITAAYLEKPVEGSTTDMVIVFSDGFGSINSVVGDYQVVYKNGTRGEISRAVFTTSDGRIYRYTILLPNDTIQIIWNITVKTELYTESFNVTLSIKELGEEKREEQPQTIYWIIAFLALFLIAVIGYRKLK